MAGISFSKGSKGKRVELETSDAHARAIEQLSMHLSTITDEGRETTVYVESAEAGSDEPRQVRIPYTDMHNPSFRYNSEAITGEGGKACADEYRRAYLRWKATGELVIQGTRTA